MDNLVNLPVGCKKHPVKVVQFGEGNFLRGFVDYILDIASDSGGFNGSVAVVKAVPFGSLEPLRSQNGRYTVYLRGMVDGKKVESQRIINVISRLECPYENFESYMELATLDTLEFIVSNTTEAGIAYDETDRLTDLPPKSYPAKLAQFLYKRFQTFNGSANKGLHILPCELIENNGTKLYEIVKQIAINWQLDPLFVTWLQNACTFSNTLVDRIVTGYPGTEETAIWEKLGYEDKLIVTGEPYALWVIEADRALREKLESNIVSTSVLFTDDYELYRERKVRILNGAHTAFALGAYLSGCDTVYEAMHNIQIRDFVVQAISEEIIPTLSLKPEDCTVYANAVIDRFSNPFVKHRLLDISLNSISKWKVRVLPSLKRFVEIKGKVPTRLSKSLAALILFYHGNFTDNGDFTSKRKGVSYMVKDTSAVLEFFSVHFSDASEALCEAVLSNISFFGEDLTLIPGLLVAVTDFYKDALNSNIVDTIFSTSAQERTGDEQ